MLVMLRRRPLDAAVEAQGRRSTGPTDDERWSTSTLETAANTSPRELRDLSCDYRPNRRQVAVV